MNTIIKTFMASVAMLCFTGSTMLAQHQYDFKKYDGSADMGILSGITPDGRWALIQNGSSSAGGSARPQVFNTTTGKAEDRSNLGFTCMSGDANIVGGSKSGQPAVYNHLTGATTVFPMPKDSLEAIQEGRNPFTGKPIYTTVKKAYTGGHITALTADGKYGVGILYTDDIMMYEGLFVDVEKGEVIPTPGLPKLDMTHLNQGQRLFTGITPDARYIIGAMSDCYLSPASLFEFVYDTQSHTYDVIGFTEHDNKAWEPHVPHLDFIDGGYLSGDGRYLAGEAYMYEPGLTANDFGSEYSLPYLYDLQTKEFKVFSQSEMKGRIAYAVDGQGTLLVSQGSKGGSGTPLRDFSVLYKGKYNIPFTTICSQYYGFDFQRRIGYENTGTPMGMSSDGTKFVSFSDPTGQSYWFDLGTSIENVCSEIDLLASYTALPQTGAEFSKLTRATITFDRNISLVSTSAKNAGLYDAEGKLVTNVAASGFKLNPENTRQLWLQFPTLGGKNILKPGERYTLIVNAGTISIEGDASITNKEIRLEYIGRADEPVQPTEILPADGSEIASFDGSSSFITLHFDTKIHANDTAQPYIRLTDGTLLSYFTAFYSNSSNGGQVTLIPNSDCFLYEGRDYEVVIPAGCITDLSGAESSANKEIRLQYKGIYKRPVQANGIIFSDNFDNLSESINTWLRYEGDHRTPTAEMQSWGFTADDSPWEYAIRDEDSQDLCIGSHSMYTPAGRSKDLIMTPLLELPDDNEIVLEFDAQSYKSNKTDQLSLLIWQTGTSYSSINDDVFEDFSDNAEEILLPGNMPIILTPGSSESRLEGDWTHYSFNLGAYKNKSIYIAFLNNNNDQSAMFIDNVVVKRNMFYKLNFSNEESLIAANDVVIKGEFAITDATLAAAAPALELKNANGESVSKLTFNDIKADEPVAFAFDAMPLTIGAENKFTIDITAGERKDKYESVIYDLAFTTTKRVVLEEMTGQGCGNCPQGILTIDKLNRQYGERFVPISIHSYTGDQLGAGVMDYNNYLGLVGAPSARIDRLENIYFPMLSEGTTYYDEYAGRDTWSSVIKQLMSTAAPADITLAASVKDGKVTLDSEVKFALNYDNKQYNIFYVFMEDGIVGYQENYFTATPKQDVLGEWCEGGKYGVNVSNFIHNDVARATFGTTYSGTPGLIPTNIEAGKVYSVSQTCPLPQNILKPENAHVAVLLIDASTGRVANCYDAKISDGTNGIEEIELSGTDGSAIYNIAGQRMQKTVRGINIVNGKKYSIK